MHQDFMRHEDYSSPTRRRRSRRSRALRRLVLPITLAIVLAMFAIPMVSLQLHGVWESRTASAEQVQLVKLNELPRTQRSELESLRDWLKEHFDDDEIEEMRDRFVAGRDPHQVREELQELAEAAARGNYSQIPRYYTDRVKGRLGEGRTNILRGHLDRMEPSSEQLRGLAIEEIYPDRKLR